jgi:3-hydroxyacyl-CoA dehydrogenase
MAASNLIKTVAVVGTGTIGASWTALMLSRGLRVVASDPAHGAEGRLREYVRKAWPALVALDPATVAESVEAAEERLTFDTRLEDHLEKVDFLQENGPEKLEYKKQMFAWLDKRCRPGVVLASSSSGLAASRYAMAAAEEGENNDSNRTDQLDSSKYGTRTLVGHPFNPPHLIPLVEIVPHPQTSPEAIEAAESFYRSLHRQPVVLRKESPGFVANRLQAALVHEAYSLVSRGFVSSADVGECKAKLEKLAVFAPTDEVALVFS